MADLSYRAFDGATGSSTSVTSDVPTHEEGDLLLAQVNCISDSGTPTISTPSGWTLLQTHNGDFNPGVQYYIRRSLFYRVASDSEPSDYTWTLTAANVANAVQIYSFDNVDTADPIDTHTHALDLDGGTSFVMDGLTTDRNRNGLVAIVYGVSAGDTDWGAPSGMTERVDTVAHGMFDQIVATAGATGDKTATSSLNMFGGWFLVSVHSDPFVPITTMF